MSVRCNGAGGVLLVNAFLNNGKFEDLYGRLSDAAQRAGTGLKIMTNAQLVSEKARTEVSSTFDFGLFWDKDIRLGEALEKGGLRLFNSSRAVEECDNKLLTYDRLRGHVPMPRTISFPFTYDNVGYTDMAFLDDIGEELGYPFVIKEARGSYGAQVYLAGNRDEARTIAASIGGRQALAQEYIKESNGRDLRINMVGNIMAAAMERRNPSDFRANISAGGSSSPHDVTVDELDIARKVMEVMELDHAGIDILFSDRGPLLCEVNSNPHFRSISMCTGVDVADIIMSRIMKEIYDEQL